MTGQSEDDGDGRRRGERTPGPAASGAAAPGSSPLENDTSAESRERRAALARSDLHREEPEYTPCAPKVRGLDPELLFTLIAENVREYAVFLMDATGTIRCWGEGARLMKWWTRRQAEGSHLRLLYPDGGSEDGTAEEHLQAAAERGEYTGEGHRLRSDGTTFWAYVTLTALRTPGGELVGFCKVTRDFTARRAVEAALRAERHASTDVQRMADEASRLRMLIASIAHELSAPLSAVLSYAALLEREIGSDERYHAHVKSLQRSGRHLMEIIHDVLDMARVQSGTLPVTRTVRRLGAAIDEALADVQEQARAAGLTLTNAVSGGAADLPYLGDEGRVRQILVNLIMNAIKFTERGGRISVSGGTGERVSGAALTGPGPWVYVRVEDTGRGIPPDRRSAVFEPYQQGDPADRHRGTGLGLSISRQLARLMGGDITLQSELGAGSTFTLWLPIAPSDPVPR